MEKGSLIIIEGPEGSGKTTQARLLEQSCKKAELLVLQTREPGGLSLAEEIRTILLHGEDLSPVTELFLFEAARSAWVKQVVEPAIEMGKMVITDRSYISTLAYQGYAGGIPLDDIVYVNRIAMQGIEPKAALLLDLDVETAFDRMSTRGIAKDRIESKALEYHRKVIEGYRQIAASGEKNIFSIDGSQSVAEVHSDIVQIINRETGLNLAILQEGGISTEILNSEGGSRYAR